MSDGQDDAPDFTVKRVALWLFAVALFVLLSPLYLAAWVLGFLRGKRYRLWMFTGGR